MSILSDRHIAAAIAAGEIDISPLQEHSLQPASVELHLGNHFQQMRSQREEVDLFESNVSYFSYLVPQQERIALGSGEFYLAHTVETVKLSTAYAARVEGKSSVGRHGLAVHVTAGFIDPGFEGQITLELVNMSPNILLLYPGMKIAQLSVLQLSGPSSGSYGDTMYNSHYQGQMGATEAASLT